MIFAFIVLILFKITEVKGECFLELLNKTFEHSDGIVGPEFHVHDSTDTNGQTKCLEKCLNMYECIAMTYEFESSTCRLFKFIPNTNIEKEKEINCQGRCITRYIAIPKYCYEISNSIPVYVRFVNQLTDCYAFANLCKSNFKLQDKIKTLEKRINDMEQYQDKMEDKIDAMVKDKIRTLEKRMDSMEQVKVETITASDGVYTGMTRNGKKHGLGTMNWSVGDMYVGNWENGLRHGYGVYLWSDGRMYSGGWDNDKGTGIGYFNWPNGEMYVGQWKDWKINGNGHLFWLDGGRYAGEWKDDKRHGSGVKMRSDGTIRKGQWRDNREV